MRNMSANGKKTICPSYLARIPIYKAYGEEVNLFMHIHVRSYDQHGDGKQMHAGYYDKYGAPMKIEDSWLEGYHAVELELADYFKESSNGTLRFPPVAAATASCHLYRDFHSVEPWNWTGWVPTQRKWLCKDRFLSNRHFISLRGNEIQNDLWDYHPHETGEWPNSNADDDYFNQLQPTDEYRGGYFYYANPWGRYIHLISLKSIEDPPFHCKRYNYIAHPLAYRVSANIDPDSSVDAMQWCIINIQDRKLNVVPDGTSKKIQKSHPAFGEDQLDKWGSMCHGMEIYNDYTYYNSSAPVVDGTDLRSGNGCLNNWRSPDYIHWFNSYPHEFGEFLFETSLRHGSYIHILAANDAMYQRQEIHFDHENSELQKDHDSKGFHGNSPYQENTVFGYTTLIDPQTTLRNQIYGNPPYNKGPDLKKGETGIFDLLTEGKFFAHTGVYNLFNYRCENETIQQCCPVIIQKQDPTKFCYEYCPEIHDLVFTLPKTTRQCSTKQSEYSIEHDTVWQFSFEIHGKETIECHRGYFKLNENIRTRLDLRDIACGNQLAWIRIQTFDVGNPQRRAWFQAIKGPMFGKIVKYSAKYGKLAEDKQLINIVHHMKLENQLIDEEEFSTFKPLRQMKIDPINDSSLIFDFKVTEDKDCLCVYNLQIMSHKQNNDISTANQERPPAYLQNVCGVFKLSDMYPTKLDLNSNWDKRTLKKDSCFFYMVSSKAELLPMPKTCIFTNNNYII